MKPLRPMPAHFDTYHFSCRHCGLNKPKKLGLIPIGWQLFKLAWAQRNWKKDYYNAATGALQSYRIQFTFMWSPSTNSVEQFGILALPLSCRFGEMSHFLWNYLYFSRDCQNVLRMKLKWPRLFKRVRLIWLICTGVLFYSLGNN